MSDSKLGTIIDGICSSSHVDSSGEILDIEGMDISSLGGPDSILNFEHNSKDHPSQVCGKVTFAKKIFKKSDCSNDREKYFWDFCKKPFVYVKGELFDHPELDHDGARNVAALLRYDNRDKGQKTRQLISFSVEGGKIEKKGMIVTKSIARDIALTIKHCNKMCIVEILEDVKARKDIYKKESDNNDLEPMMKNELRRLLISDIKKSNINPLQDIQKTDWKSNIPTQKEIKEIKLPKKITKTFIYDSDNNMRKTLVAGMMNSSPDARTGMAALASEELVGKKQKKLKKNENNKTFLEHYSTQTGLKTIDPNKMGTGVDARTKGRSLENKISFFYPHNYENPESVVKTGSKSKYLVEVPSHFKIYDSKVHGRDIIDRSKNKYGIFTMDDFISNLKNDGFHGFKSSPNGTEMIAMFHELPVHSEEDLVNIKKSIRSAIAGLGIAATLGLNQPISPDAVPQHPKTSQETPKQEDLFGEFGSHPMDSFLHNTMQSESSGGKNLKHSKIKHGIHAGQEAIGKFALMPNTLKEIAKRFNMQGKSHPKIDAINDMPEEKIKEYITKNPSTELALARSLANHIFKTHKDPVRASYAWKYGHNLKPNQINEKKLKNDIYLQKIKLLTQGKSVQGLTPASVAFGNKRTIASVDKSEKLEKMSRPLFQNKELGLGPDIRSDVQYVDPEKEYKIKKPGPGRKKTISSGKLESKKLRSKVSLKTYKPQPGNKSSAKQNVEANKAVYENVLDPKDTYGENITDPEFGINRSYVYKSPESKESKKFFSGKATPTFRTKQFSEYPKNKEPDFDENRGTAIHENIHGFFGDIENKYGRKARSGVVSHLINNIFHPKDIEKVKSHILDRGYEEDHPYFNEELITHIAGILNSPSRRKDFLENASHLKKLRPDASPEDVQQAKEMDRRMDLRLKRAWESSHQFIKDKNQLEPLLQQFKLPEVKKKVRKK